MEIDGEMASDQKYSHIEGSLTLQYWRICGNKNFPLAKKISLRPPQTILLFFLKNWLWLGLVDPVYNSKRSAEL